MQRLTAPCIHRFREKASVFLTELHPAADAEAREASWPGCASGTSTPTTTARPGGSWAAPRAPTTTGSPRAPPGAPMLRVLEGEDLVDVLAVCIRWFGGTKLGTGGLVRAYTEGVQGALAEAREQGLLEPVRLWRQGAIAVPPGPGPPALLGAGGLPGGGDPGPGLRAGDGRAHLPHAPGRGREAALEALWLERSRGGQRGLGLRGRSPIPSRRSPNGPSPGPGRP